MNIEKNVKEKRITLKIEGRLDTVTAPELETVINSCIKEAEELVFLCEGLEYISSAGLRVVLKAQKIMNKQGSMRLVGVSDAVMEIFDMTGFSDILTIE